MRTPEHLTILGAGPAGLAVGFYAGKHSLPFTIYEATNRIGGNCITLQCGKFLFDSGAHRFHDKDPNVTKDIQQLLKEEFHRIDIPSQIYHNGNFIHFPISPLNLFWNVGIVAFAKMIVEIVWAKLDRRPSDDSFEQFVLHYYGKTIAEQFLLNYAEKLWGRPCQHLSSEIAGKRLKGMNIGTLLKEMLFKGNGGNSHVEGMFYYPEKGIGTITEKIAEFCGKEHIIRNSTVTKIFHDRSRIQAIEINGEQRVAIDSLVSTLPIDMFLKRMEPSPPPDLLRIANAIRYRDLILVSVYLNQESITHAATVYFPNSTILFTRIYEPKNRSALMSPQRKTTLVAEIPCYQGDHLWELGEQQLIHLVKQQLIQIGWFQENDVIDASVHKLPYAYPVLERDIAEKRQPIFRYLQRFENVKISGRNGRFVYAWIHDMMRWGKELVEEWSVTVPAS